MNDPEMIRAYADFIGGSAQALFLFLLPICVAFGVYWAFRNDSEERELRKEFEKLKELFESVERQTDYQYDALLSLLKDVKTLQEKVELKNEDDNANV